MRFIIDAMFSPAVAVNLAAMGHDVASVIALGDPELPDGDVIVMATTARRVIVTENFRHFAHVTTCPVLLIQKAWWPRGSFTLRLSNALGKWATANPEPGPYARWLDAEFR